MYVVVGWRAEQKGAEAVTVEEMIWADLVRRKRFASAKQIMKTAKSGRTYTKAVLQKYVVKGVLETKITRGEIVYKIKD